MGNSIAVVMIVKNEEVLLARCLESVKDADAIYITDTGSSDSTVEIARKYTNNVDLGYIWDDDFSSAQNYAKRNVKESWILSIDADEVLLSSMEEVRKAIEVGKDMIRVNMIAEGGNRLEFGFGRLFRNSPDIYWCQKIHKHLNIPGEGEHVGNIRIMFGYSPAHANDPDRALRILERVVAEEGDAAGRNLYYLGREYWYKGNYPMCTRTLGRYVQISQWDAEKAESFLIMSQCYSRQGMDEDARDAALQAIKINPNFKEAVEWMGHISDPQKAKQWYRMAKWANNNDVMWDRIPATPNKDIILIEPHQDDSVLFAAYTLMRLRPLVISVTSSHIQPNRGDIGCDENTRRKETVEAMKILGCPVLFMDIPDTELTEENFRQRLYGLNPETVYIPAAQGGNKQHDLINKVCMEYFGRDRCEQYSTYKRNEFFTEEGYEIKPTHSEIELKNKALDCYKSQLQLPSTLPHFEAVRNKSEWLI